MIIGHVALAYGAKAVRRGAPLGWLLVGALLPDVGKVTAHAFLPVADAEVVSHSIPFALMLGGLLYLAWRLRGGGWDIGLLLVALCLSHPVADLFTGCKPWLPGGASLGLMLYERPIIDAVFECVLFAVLWWIARRGEPRGWWPGRTIVLVGACVVQVAVIAAMTYGEVFFVGRSEWVWPVRGYTHPPRYVRELVPRRRFVGCE